MAAMKRFLPLLFAPVLVLAQDSDLKIERFDPAFDQLVAPGTRIEKLAEGFHWSEGPVWKDGSLYFSDVPENKLYRWQPGEKSAKVFLQPSGGMESTPAFKEPGSNGLTLDAKGNLILCQQGTQRVARLEPDGKQVPLTHGYEGKHFNSPNDVIYSKNGNLYFTDPPYGLEGLNDSPLKQLKFNGVFLVKPSGETTAIIKDLTFPNGLAFSPDEKLLYVGVSDPQSAKVWVYDVQPDGTVANKRLFFDAGPLVSDKRVGLPDGMKVDAQGDLWCAAAGGVLVISPTGKHLGTIVTNQQTGNCAWGDDGSTLYICANMFICRVKTLTHGVGMVNK
ncbi:gluconolactonase [Chthoniobacter flavus]|nr:gluconolactonase [Chthoniobacter flavus]